MLKSNILFSFVFAMIVFSSLGFASDNAILVGLDKSAYLPDENITISGVAYIGTSYINATNVSVTISNSSGLLYDDDTTLTDENGTFLKNIELIPDTGVYTIGVSVGDVSSNMTFRVSSAEDYRIALVNESIVVQLSSVKVDHNITSVDSKITGDMMYGNYTYAGNGETYFFVLENGTDTDNYDTIYI